MSRIVQLHNIRIRSASNAHDDLPVEMRMFAQLLVDGTIVHQTVPVDAEVSQGSLSWKLRFDCLVPSYASTFRFAIMRKTQVNRVLGSVEVARGEALSSGEHKKPLRLPLVKVNLDGPLLELSAAFSVSSSSNIPSGLDLTDITGIRMGPVAVLAIVHDLDGLYEAANGQINVDSQLLLMMHERVLLLSPAEEMRGSLLGLLGQIWFIQWTKSQTIEELNQAVCVFEDAVRDLPMDTDGLHNLGNALLQRIDKPSMLDAYSTALFTRFLHLGTIDDLNKAVSIQEGAVYLTPRDHPNKPLWLCNLALFLLRRFERLGHIDDLTKCLMMQEDGVSLTPDDHPEKPSMLNNLGSFLLTRFEHMEGGIGDLNKAVLIHQDSVRLTQDGHPEKPSRLHNLSMALLRRFVRLGSLEDIDKSILTAEEAVRLSPQSHPMKAMTLDGLGITLVTRFRHSGNPDDLSKALSMLQAAVDLTSKDHSSRPVRLDHLGSSLLTRFEYSGDVSDINKCVAVLEETIHLTPDGHVDKPGRMGNLGIALRTRFQQFGDLADLNKSVLIQQEAVRLTPESDLGGKAIVSKNLASALRTRFERLGAVDDLNQSISMCESVVRLTPNGHPDRASRLNLLGYSLLTRFEKTGNLKDLDNSIFFCRDAVQITPDSHPNKPTWLINMSNGLSGRFRRLNNLSDLNTSVSLRENAVRLTPDGHPDKPLWLYNLADTISLRFQRLHDPRDVGQMILHYSAAARSTTGPPNVRFNAASWWARWARNTDHPSVLEAYNFALELLPELAWLGLSISDRHHQILQAGTLTRDAAAAAIASGQPEKAVEWLEQGRSIIWGQLLELRTPVDALKESHPAMADRLILLSTKLEGVSSGESQSGTPPSLQSIAGQSHVYAEKRNKLLKDIRKLDGFQRFLLPKTMHELTEAAPKGPVIILNVTYSRCDALILMPGLGDEVIHVPLANFTSRDIQALAESLGTILHDKGRSDRLVGRREGYVPPEDTFSHILAELWVRVAKPVLNALAITTPSKEAAAQRIWWCLTGPLTFLPIHAAGIYGEKEFFGSKLSDFVVSSYTPSLTALIQGFRPQSDDQPELQLLAVAQPSATGQLHIPGTRKEINNLEQLAKSSKIPVMRLDENMATVESVQRGMKDSRWVHFASHGVQDRSDPTQSALLLARSSRLTLAKIIQLSLPHADLAFLSACQTAAGDKSLQEESVHLAAGMLLAGYRGVIATMWTIMDNDAPQVASDVYSHLFKASPPDPTGAAEALHLAIRKLREGSGGNKSFFHWVPFIHVGV
ncbi:CHAT domain-containing protein [Mycena vulgaris]|nr:CHAT domain-containing protein [Mycena vulgaris]